MKNLLISFSGGRTSAFMARYIKENPKFEHYNVLVVFANTGKEKEETLDFVNKCDTLMDLNVVWVEADVNPEKGKGTAYKIVDFETASRNGEPFEEVIKKYGLPSKLFRHCTRELKEYPIHKYAKEYFKGEKYQTAIGIRADEKHRLSNKEGNIYPLAEINITEEFIRGWWARQSFDLDLKDFQGNCDLCFLKSVRKKKTIVKDDPEIAEWWAKMEELYPRENQFIFDMYRDLPVSKLITESQGKFTPAVDKKELRDKQTYMFDPEEDMEFDCFCKSV